MTSGWPGANFFDEIDKICRFIVVQKVQWIWKVSDLSQARFHKLGEWLRD
jgi:hypothetical protein